MYQAIGIGDGVLYQDAALIDENLQAMREPISLFRCPSDIGLIRVDNGGNAQRGARDANDKWVTTTISNYVGSNSSGAMGYKWGSPEPRGSGSDANINYAERANGMFFGNSGVKFRDVTDGLSSTILLGERCWQMNGITGIVDCRAATVHVIARNGNSLLSGNRGHGQSYSMFLGKFAINQPGVIFSGSPNACVMGLASLHVGGVQVAMGDGRVRFLSENIDHRVDLVNGTEPVDSTYERLIGIKDGQVTGNF
ncbi:hypothetical protein KOR42_53740 [Thalassoglobus neptunius]|uniref:DUF1559 domain-containing protein n=1 Tax=Thalassoglobus neptunius TaxID=1938619 RepID=A0A5C5V8D1_9PLAN|nr:hypothetical protein KOR42_53740 [Thalassoglobus neptunius]